MNNWNIPIGLENEIRNRDKICVYCGIEFSKSEKKSSATWEHIINDEDIITLENITLCCCSCNASKGARKLSEWIKSGYCQNKGINYSTVSPIIRSALDKGC